MHESSEFDARRAGHEPEAVNVRIVLRWGVVLCVTIAMAFVSMALLRGFFDRELGDDPTVGILSRDETPVPPGVPALDPDQAAESQQLRATQQAWLDQYQWMDRAKGVARIPIDRAMAELATRGLPATPPATITEIMAPQPNE